MDLQAYLSKRYGAATDSASLKTEKKKKKKKKQAGKETPGAANEGVKIVDDDAVWQKNIDEDSEEGEEEAPAVVENEEINRMRRLEQLRRKNLLRGEDGSGWVEVTPTTENGRGGSSPKVRHDSPDLSPARRGASGDMDRRRHESSPDLSPPRQGNGRQLSPDSSPPRQRSERQLSPDLSPPRQRGRRHDSPDASPKEASPDSDLSPPRRGNEQDQDILPPRRRGNLDQDLSPPRRHDSPDLSPPRRRVKQEDDLSPPRRRHDSPDLSLPRRRVKEDDLSPPRRRGNMDQDLSPPRRRHDSPDLSPPRRRVKRDEDLSPPRRGKLDQDLSPPRRRHDSPDLSPPRRRVKQEEDLSPPRRRSNLDQDLSPPRRRHDSPDASPLRKRRRNDSPGASPARRNDGKQRKAGAESRKNVTSEKAGLKTGRELRQEINQKQLQDAKMFDQLDSSVTGRGAETVYRDKHGRRLAGLEEFMKQQQGPAKPAEKPLEWGSGLAQKRESERRQKELEAAIQEPFARTKDDLDAVFKNRIRWGDPMAHLVNQNDEMQLEDFSRNEKMKESGFNVPQDVPAHSWLKRGHAATPNRYNIRPGRHWDGVDRSNGFEEKLFTQQNEKKAMVETAYRWSVADM